jgi:uncharacterized repeat protein (TIGR02059 family)
MKDTQSIDDVTKDCLRNMAGYYGTYDVLDTNAHTVPCMGLRSLTACVIAVLETDTHDILSLIGYNSVSIAAGDEVFFGHRVEKIQLTSGTCKLYRAESVPLPASPKIIGIPATAANGATILVQFSETMANPAAYAAAFVLKVNGTPVTLTSVALANPAIGVTITPTAAITNGKVVTLTVQSTNIKSAAGAFFAPGCVDYPIKNAVPA